MKNRWLLAMLCALVSLFTMAQEKKLFSLEDLNYGGTNAYQLLPENRYTAWWGNQLVHVDIEQCSIVDKKTGKEQLLLTLDEVNQWVSNTTDRRVRHLLNASFPYPDQPIVAVDNHEVSMLVDFKRHKVVWSSDKAGMQASDWCAASKATAYVEDHQLCVADADGTTQQVTTDGSRDIVYGQSVHRNEFGIEKGTFWNEQGNKLAFYRMDQSMVADYPQVDIDNRIATHEPDKYPMAGENSHTVTVGIYDVESHKTIYLQTPQSDATLAEGNQLDDVPVYFTNMAWSPDGKTVYLFELNRDQNHSRLVAYDAGTGKRMGEIYHERSEKYVEPLHPIVFLPWDDSKFIMQSQRDGYNHLYLYSKEGKLLKQLTRGAWVVEELVGFDTQRHAVIILSNEVNPIQRNIFSVDVKTGRRTRLDNGHGWHTAELSDKGDYLVDRYSEPQTPRNICITATDGKAGSSTTYLTAADSWSDYEQPIFECGTIKAADDVTDLYYRMVKPHDFDPAKKYPTVVYVYGGPHAHNVDTRWHYASRSWETYMAQKEYIVFVLDNRGSENRGLAFEQATFRQLGQVEMLDQMRGVDFLRALPYIDADRMGIHGWSFGGFMTISLMTNYPDVFKVGVAGGPVIDWKWYEVMYGERYMDTPQQNPEGYEKTSLIGQAGNLKGKLQIITGYNDDTVVPQHCLSFLGACILQGTQPDFFVYPGEPHNMRGHQSVHLHERITQYFEDYLK